MSRVAQHYGRSDLVEAALEALRRIGKDQERLKPDDLAPVDEFHIRGREATEELASLAAPTREDRVLDIGSGIGGSARYLSSRFGCRTVGVDLTPEYCDAATQFSELVGLSELTEFHCVSALDTPFPDSVFDMAWTQHVQMNIEDKAGLYRETARVLRPGGRFVMHDILAGPGGEPYYPTPWASESAISFLATSNELQQAVQAAGFRIAEWRDTTDASRDWFFARLQATAEQGPPPVGLHLLMGDDAAEKFQNVGRGLQENRLTVCQALLMLD